MMKKEQETPWKMFPLPRRIFRVTKWPSVWGKGETGEDPSVKAANWAAVKQGIGGPPNQGTS